MASPWGQAGSPLVIDNIVIYNGWKDRWVAPQVGLWNNGNPENFIITHNNVWGNLTGNYENMDDLTGVNGNISLDPLFVGDQDFHLREGSPCRYAGSPSLSESNGSISDMGMYGGPGAR